MSRLEMIARNPRKESPHAQPFSSSAACGAFRAEALGTSDRVADDEVVAAVENRLMATLPSAAVRVTIRAVQGVVTLSGVVATNFERDFFVQITERLSVVREVVSELTVRSPSPTSFAFQRVEPVNQRSSVMVFVSVAAALILAFGGWHWASVFRADAVPVVPLSLSVQFKEKPATGAYLRLFTVAADAAQPVATGRVEEEGRVRWSVPAVPAGEYIVTAVWSRPVFGADGVRLLGPNVLEADLARPSTSRLRLEVANQGGTPRLQLAP